MNFSVLFQDNILSIEKEEKGQITERWTKSLADIKRLSSADLDFVIDQENQFQLYLWQPVEDKILMVYSKVTKIKYALTSVTNASLRLIKRYNNTLNVSINKDDLTIQWYGAVINLFHMKLSDMRFCIGDVISKPLDIPVFTQDFKDDKMKNTECIQTIRIKTSDLIQKDEKINSRIFISFKINDIPIEYPVRMEMPADEDKKYLYVPLCSTFYKDHAIHLRRNGYENLMLICRKMETVEYTRGFRFWESSFISKMLYHLGQNAKKKSAKKVCLFYEKFSMKAEEGTFDIFEKTRAEGFDGSYFIIDAQSPDYDKIKNKPGVIKKYSAKYYWLLYRANAYISTEIPMHLNLLRSNNSFFRRTVAENPLIFLQHGVTYLKCHGKNSPLIAGKEGAPSYIVVGSEKEKQVVAQSMNIPEDHILKTGLPIFSKISHKHLNQHSDDIAVIMLTWKPYEEHLEDFRESSYYKNTLRIYDVLSKYLPAENVIIVAHPRIESLIAGTPLASSIWKKPISEVLSIAKLLITDYSSVCYNSFYQGGGVVFYQEDLEYYEQENGKLIPTDDEYIGKRIYSIDQLEQILKEGIQNQQIDLEYFRTKEHDKRYLTINEYTDGKNIDRICDELKRLHIIS